MSEYGTFRHPAQDTAITIIRRRSDFIGISKFFGRDWRSPRDRLLTGPAVINLRFGAGASNGSKGFRHDTIWFDKPADMGYCGRSHRKGRPAARRRMVPEIGEI